MYIVCDCHHLHHGKTPNSSPKFNEPHHATSDITSRDINLRAPCFLNECVIKSGNCVVMVGRSAASICISKNVMPRNVLANFECIPKVLYDNMSDWLVWLVEHRLLRNFSNTCSNCQGLSLLIVVRSHRADYLGNAVVATREQSRSSTHCGISTQKMAMHYWVYEVKCIHVKLLKEIDS